MAYPPVEPLIEAHNRSERAKQSRHDALERLRETAIECAALWIEWASGGSQEGTDLATRVRLAQEMLGGAALDLIWAESPDMARAALDRARAALKAARGER